jgi:hypothetical protein
MTDRGDPNADEARVLLVGHFGLGARPDLARHFGNDMRIVDFSGVGADLLDGFNPHFVVSPILTQSFDIMDLATLLWRLRFSGAYRALVEVDLPNPSLVIREVRAACPGLDVDILRIDLGPDG